MRSEGRGRGGGKLILFGEHAVVYGHAALAVGVDRGTEVTVHAVSPSSGTGGVVRIEGLDPRVSTVVREMFGDGVGLSISSDIPVGRGMGSSAALAVALVRAKADLDGVTLSGEDVWSRSLDIERAFHGNPSGVDNAVAARGGGVLFRKGPPVEMTEVALPALHLVVLDSGTSGDTGKLVAHVASQRPLVDPQLERMGEIAETASEHLHHPATLGALMSENHEMLRQVGVSTERLDELVAFAIHSGALGAKLSGAGGGGVVIALASDEGVAADLVRRAEARGIPALPCRIREAR